MAGALLLCGASGACGQTAPTHLLPAPDWDWSWRGISPESAALGSALRSSLCVCWLLFSHSLMSDSLQPHGLQHARLPCPSPSPELALTQRCQPTISSSVVPFSSCLQSFPASGSFPMSQFFASGGQSIGASASASVLPMNIQGLFPLRLTGFISLPSKGHSRVFSNTMVQKHQFLGT